MKIHPVIKNITVGKKEQTYKWPCTVQYLFEEEDGQTQ
jgi:hypothetical protein